MQFGAVHGTGGGYRSTALTVTSEKNELRYRDLAIQETDHVYTGRPRQGPNLPLPCPDQERFVQFLEVGCGIEYYYAGSP